MLLEIQELGNSLPVTVQSVHHLISLQEDFVNYVVCPNCDSVYEYDSCFEISANDEKESKYCNHIRFPKHPQASHRKPCESKT